MSGIDDLTISLTAIVGTRFLGAVVFLELFLRRRQSKYAVLALAWLTYMAGPVWGVLGYTSTGNFDHPLFGYFAAIGTVLLLAGIFLYYQAISPGKLIAGIAMLVMALAIVVILAPASSGLLAILAQMMFFLLTLTVVLFRRKWFMESGGGASYYWLLAMTMAGLFHAFGFQFVYADAPLSARFLFTGFVNIVFIIFFLHFEYNQSLRQLKNSEQKYHSLFENMNEGFAFHEIIVNEDKTPIDYRFIDLNPAFERFTGLEREQVIGKTVREILPGIEQDPADWIGTFGKVALSGQEISFENFSEGIGKWFHVHAFPPEIGRFAVTFTDITERKQAEQERERLNLELSQKNQELEQIVYVTSHDLRAPLVNVQGFSQELKDELADLREMLDHRDIPQELRQKILGVMDDEILDDLGFIQTSVEKMDSLLSGLLKLSRLGRAALRIESLDMNRLIAQVSAVFEFQIKEAGVALDISPLPSCLGDATQLNQVFSNLLGNALKFLEPSRTGLIKIWGYREAEHAMYCLEDNGIGMAVGHQDKIFEIFHRLNPGQTPGEGLGLTIVKKILERHNGKIWVESEPGQGSRFFVALPGVTN